MKALYARFDAALEREPVPGPHLNGALTSATHEWLDDRLVQDDVLDALREVLPDAPDEQLAGIIGAIGRAVRQP